MHAFSVCLINHPSFESLIQVERVRNHTVDAQAEQYCGTHAHHWLHCWSLPRAGAAEGAHMNWWCGKQYTGKWRDTVSRLQVFGSSWGLQVV